MDIGRTNSHMMPRRRGAFPTGSGTGLLNGVTTILSDERLRDKIGARAGPTVGRAYGARDAWRMAAASAGGVG